MNYLALISFYSLLTVAQSAAVSNVARSPACAAVDNSCPLNGALLCNGATQFGICNGGKVIWQNVAAGTACKDGEIFSTEACAVPSQTATPKTPTFSDYAPVRTKCPADQEWIRPAAGISKDESAWVQGRKIKVLDALNSYLGRLNLESFDVEDYITRLKCNYANVPTIGMAISGGSWASALTATGALRALDARFPDALEWRTGGILQTLTYLSGLSGGAWPVMSLSTYNFPTVVDMVSSWHVNVTRLSGQNDLPYAVNETTLFEQIVPKYEAGYNVSFSDLQGRAFAYEYVAGPKGGLSTTASGIADLSNFQNYEMPFPMWQATLAQPDDVEYYGLQAPFANNTIYEFNPLEVGAWRSPSGGPSAFFPMKYMGTKMSSGKPVDDCIIGFDRASFILGVAGDADNFWYIADLSNNTEGQFWKRQDSSFVEPEFPLSELTGLKQLFQKYFNYTLSEAIYSSFPNPFATEASTSYNSTPPANVTLLDESEMHQSLPLWSQIQPARNPEFIITWENSVEALPYLWNNGTNLYSSYLYAVEAGIPFPIVPEATTFVNRNYTTKPVFFGCDANLTTTNDTRAPIILYLANSPYSSFTNYSGFEETFSYENMQVIMTNSANMVTQGNSTLDSDWPECLGCAAIDRSLAKVGMERTAQCQQCMSRWCWDGTSDNTPTGWVDLSLVLDPSLSFAEWNKTSPYWTEVS